MKNVFLERVYSHFGFERHEEDASENFYAIKGEGYPKFLLDMKQAESYERYVISNPLLLNLTYESSEVFSSTFLDYHTQFFTHEPPNERNAPQLHKHNYFELVYVCEGQLDLIIEDSRHRMLPGDACIINTNVRHRELRTSERMVIYLGIDPENLPLLSALMEGNTDASLDDFFFRNRQNAEDIEYLNFSPLDAYRSSTGLKRAGSLFYSLLEEMISQEVGYQQICEVTIQRLFSIFQDPSAYICSNTRFQALTGDALFEQTLRCINEKKRKVSRHELEEELRYNGTYISRVFLKRTGQTLAEYNRDICMTEAARLLLNTGMSVRDICHKIGYENKTAFYNCFRNKYGITPQQYRDMKYQETAKQDDTLARLDPHFQR